MPELTLDIHPDHLKIIQTILKKYVPDNVVWVFGSRVISSEKKNAKKYSDLDLCIVTETPLSIEILTHLDNDFSESDLPYKVDVIDWAATNEAFRKIIEKNKIVLSGAIREES